MKLLLPLTLISILASCTSPKNELRPSAELPDQGAPMTNKGLRYYSKAAALGTTILHDVPDDSIAYGGKVAVRQARDYTNIGFNSVRRADDLVHREANRYTDYAMDTVDDVADLEVREVRRWPKFASKTVKRGFGSTRKVYQASITSYADSVDRTYFSFWHIFTPPEPKPWMVGSVNDRIRPARVPGGVWTEDFATTTVVETVTVDDGKGYVGRITK